MGDIDLWTHTADRGVADFRAPAGKLGNAFYVSAPAALCFFAGTFSRLNNNLPALQWPLNLFVLSFSLLAGFASLGSKKKGRVGLFSTPTGQRPPLCVAPL